MKLNKYFKSELEVSGISMDTRYVKPGDMFVCIDGINNDGHKYASKAVELGAVCVVSQRSVDVGVENFIVEDTARFLSEFAADFYNDPSSKLNVIGITGTDGKTTTTSILHQMYSQIEIAGYIGTNGVIYDDVNIMLGHVTTPQSHQLQEVLAKMVDANVNHVALEVTSHALVLNRCSDVKFSTVAITNITSEHMDLHKNQENYVQAKQSIFDFDALNKVLNADDAYFDRFRTNIDNFVSYGVKNDADFKAVNIKYGVSGLSYDLVYKNEIYAVKLQLIGDFNVYNSLCALAIAVCEGLSIEQAIILIQNVKPIAGRANFIEEGQDFKLIVDFAHTAYSIELIIAYFKQVLDLSKNRIIVVCGSAGKRDKTKRPAIGKVVSENASYAIFTNEDPRDEDEMQILKDIAAGAVNDNYELIVDRKAAILRACKLANADDVVLLLGKGIENSMEFIDGEHPYDETSVAIECVKEVLKA